MPFLFSICAGYKEDEVRHKPRLFPALPLTTFLLCLRLCRFFFVHCISFSSKNRSFNLGRTINWDEKKSEVWGGILYQTWSNWHRQAVSLLGIHVPSSVWASGKSGMQKSQTQFHSTSLLSSNMPQSMAQRKDSPAGISWMPIWDLLHKEFLDVLHDFSPKRYFSFSNVLTCPLKN